MTIYWDQSWTERFGVGGRKEEGLFSLNFFMTMVEMHSRFPITYEMRIEFRDWHFFMERGFAWIDGRVHLVEICDM
jgi:hypothetical protein